MAWTREQTGEQVPIESVERSATFDAEEGRANGNLHRGASRMAAPEDEGGIEMIEMTNRADEGTNIEATQGAEISTNAPNPQAFNVELLSRQVHLTFDPENRQSMFDSMFLTHLEETQEYEKGMTFRLLVWVPMLLALLKILSVTGGWSILGPKVCGCMFFCSWLTAELITIVASRGRLSREQRDRAAQLSRCWRKEWGEEIRLSTLGLLSCTLLLGFNV